MTSGRKSGIIKNRLLYSNEKGIALVSALLFLTVLIILGTTAVVISTTDIKIGANYRTSKQALYDAEAGIQYAIKQIENGLSGGTLSLSGSSISVNYTAPSGFSFNPITTLTQAGTNRYKFQVTGHAANNASCTIEAIIKRGSIFEHGLFGNLSVDLKTSGRVYSYDSRRTPNPTAADSTREADVGSNVIVQTDSASYIDGDVRLGDDGAGHEAVYSGPSDVVSGTVGLDVARTNPDPLGAVGGNLAATFAAVSTTNDNATSGITGTTINLSSGTVTLYGKAGGANYYLTSVTLGQGSTLEIDSSTGPVNIYLNGPLTANTGSTINTIKIVDGEQRPGLPTDVTVYSNSTSSISFMHGSAFRGTIYSPYAPVELKNSADVYGVLWAKTATIKNSGRFYFDTAMKDQDRFLTNDITIVSWREVR